MNENVAPIGLLYTLVIMRTINLISSRGSVLILKEAVIVRFMGLGFLFSTFLEVFTRLLSLYAIVVRNHNAVSFDFFITELVSVCDWFIGLRLLWLVLSRLLTENSLCNLIFNKTVIYFSRIILYTNDVEIH